MSVNSFDILFSRPTSGQDIADTLDLEELALEALDLECAWVSTEQLVDGEAAYALESIPAREGRVWLHRGWMLKEEEYEELFDAVLARGESLLVTPEEYANAHYLPNYLEHIEGRTAETRCIEGHDAKEAWAAAQELRGPWTIKDHVKSAKEDWFGACFVPEGATFEHFASVCEALVDHRGERFERGLVVRSMLDLAPLPMQSPERPLFDEHRLFVWQGEVVAQAPYHDFERAAPPLDFDVSGIDSPFFSVDVARLRNDEWAIIEINDGGVSTLPPLMDPRELYSAMVSA